MGVIGWFVPTLWIVDHNPTDHLRMSAEELKFISENGAVVEIWTTKSRQCGSKRTQTALHQAIAL